MKSQTRTILLTILLSCIAIALVETVLRPGYVIKSVLKLVFFGGALCLYHLRFPRDRISSLFRAGTLRFALLLGVGIYGVILAAFFLFRPFLNLDAIAAGLLEKEGVSRSNFLYVPCTSVWSIRSWRSCCSAAWAI